MLEALHNFDYSSLMLSNILHNLPFFLLCLCVCETIDLRYRNWSFLGITFGFHISSFFDYLSYKIWILVCFSIIQVYYFMPSFVSSMKTIICKEHTPTRFSWMYFVNFIHHKSKEIRFQYTNIWCNPTAPLFVKIYSSGFLRYIPSQKSLLGLKLFPSILLELLLSCFK